MLTNVAFTVPGEPQGKGRPRVNVPLRLPRWMAEWIAEQCAEGPPYKTATQLIEAAMVKAYSCARRRSDHVLH